MDAKITPEKTGRSWTDSQRKAFSDRGRSLVVSAGAGSGKTATLIERITRLIIEEETKADVSRILAVTFTRNAADELRSRITDSLSAALSEKPGDERLLSQLSKTASAQICTIDSYYLGLVKRNFQKTDLPVSVRMAGTEETNAILTRIIPDVIERMFETDEDFPELVNTLTVSKKEGDLSDVILKIAETVNQKDAAAQIFFDAADRLDKAADGEFFDSEIGKLFKNAVGKIAACELERCEAIKTKYPLGEFAKYSDWCDSLIEWLRRFSDAAKSNLSYANLREISDSFCAKDHGNMGKGKATDESKEALASLKSVHDAIKQLQNDYFLVDSSLLSRDLKAVARINRCLGKTVSAVLDSYTTEKRRQGIADFPEIKRTVKRLLQNEDGSPSDLARSERDRFDYVFVDEYQDTDEDQDLIFRLISKETNRFFVGDVKQSIYRFRNANPEVFSSYRSAYPKLTGSSEPGKPASIYMSDNFRCSENIIRFTNFVCGYLFRDASKMRIRGEGVNYLPEDDLIPHSQPGLPPVRLVSAGRRKRDGANPDADLAFLVEDVRKRATAGSERPDWGKIVILGRKNAQIDRVARALSDAGIPAVCSSKEKFFENPEVSLFCSILKAIDNPMRDIPLAGALRSPVFGLSLSDIVTIRAGRTDMTLWESLQSYAADKESDPKTACRCRSAVERIRDYRKTAASMPVDRFVRFLWKDTDAASYAGAEDADSKSSPYEKQSNLRLLYDYARKFGSTGSGSLHDFVSALSIMIRNGEKLKIEREPSPDAVSLMTVHQAKGLEFDVVYLIGTDAALKAQSSKSKYRFNELGYIDDIFAVSGFSKRQNPLSALNSTLKEQGEADENVSLLYVALTRAKKELIILSSSAVAKDMISPDTDFSRSYFGMSSGHIAYGAARSDEWISCAIKAFADNGGCFELENFASRAEAAESSEEKAVPAAETDESAGEAEAESKEKAAAAAEIAERIRKRISFSYPSGRTVTLPVKLSVSRLYPDVLSEDAPAPVPKAETDVRPRFLGAGPDAAAKGTATHVFLQFCDFSKDYPTVEDIEIEKERLVSGGFISATDADVIRTAELKKFFASGFYKMIREAADVMRERRFTYLSDAADYVESPAEKLALKGEKVLVQGVIDIIVIRKDGSMILCDYKTDRIPKDIAKSREAVAAMMSERHGAQLGYYRDAVKFLFGQEPSKIMVFPLAFGEAVDVYAL